MCIAIYLALMALFLFYSDYVIDQYALAVTQPGGETMVVAVGWEMAPVLWPLLVVAMVVASAITLFMARWLAAK